MEAKKNTSVKDIIGKLGPLLALIILCVGLQNGGLRGKQGIRHGK